MPSRAPSHKSRGSSAAHVRRELPSALVHRLHVEREPTCVVALDALYLADDDGVLFKRATPEEAASLPVVTGVRARAT